MTDDLATWLRAQLDEDERVAQASWQGNGWRHENQPSEVWTGISAPGHTPIPIAKAWDDPTAAHIAHHDPARVLREVEAKRRIIDEYDRAWANVKAHPRDLAAKGATLIMISVVKALALPYADRPGYREEWRP